LPFAAVCVFGTNFHTVGWAWHIGKGTRGGGRGGDVCDLQNDNETRAKSKTNLSDGRKDIQPQMGKLGGSENRGGKAETDTSTSS